MCLLRTYCVPGWEYSSEKDVFSLHTYLVDKWSQHVSKKAKQNALQG